MREILFRGKRVDNGEWVYGDLLRAKGYVNRIEYTVIFTDPAEFPKGEYFGAVHILPETVGQFTGLRDKNGKRIFEGDIVKHYNMWNDPEAYDVGHVYYFQDRCKWKRTTFDGFNKTGRPIDDPEMHVRSKYEVIGNIYDNSELIAEVKGC